MKGSGSRVSACWQMWGLGLAQRSGSVFLKTSDNESGSGKWRWPWLGANQTGCHQAGEI